MGRQNYSQVGYGYTEEEARRDAIEEARDMYGDQEGYSGAMNCSTGEEDNVKCIEKPKLAKTCKVDKKVQKGARKWETVFVIKPSWGGTFSQSKTVRGTQGQALKEAKAMALKNQQEYTIEIKKQLVEGSSEIATVSPKKSQRGKWLFTGIARC